jgi:hypothetical protein
MTVVYILINTELGMEEDLLQELRKMENKEVKNTLTMTVAEGV